MFLSNVASVVLLCALRAAASAAEVNPLSDEFIDLINSKQNFWTAGRNFDKDVPLSYLKTLSGVIEDGDVELPVKLHDPEVLNNLPENFDLRKQWPNCSSLNNIRNQDHCGSCWAFGAVEAMTDRYCIHSNGKHNFNFSAEDLLSCCKECGSCEGGYTHLAWQFWLNNGIVSGGGYKSKQGCRPYTVPPCTKKDCPPIKTPQCKKKCIAGYSIKYPEDKRYGEEAYTLPSNDRHIMAEIYLNGPVEASFDTYPDFHQYKHGVYIHVAGTHSGRHAVKLLGWGVAENCIAPDCKLNYWIAANSWGDEWGDKGFFKILRGVNECRIEDKVVAGIPIIK